MTPHFLSENLYYYKIGDVCKKLDLQIQHFSSALPSPVKACMSFGQIICINLH